MLAQLDMFATVPYKPFTPPRKILPPEPLLEFGLSISTVWMDHELSATSGTPAVVADIEMGILGGRNGMLGWWTTQNIRDRRN